MDLPCISIQFQRVSAPTNQKKYEVALLPKKWVLGRYVATVHCQHCEKFCNLLISLQTIISLALILKHPAPELPVSGSNTSCLSNRPAIPGSNTPNWNKDLYNPTSSDNPLRASILSRGTLVICPVSLVGQWIEGTSFQLIVGYIEFILTLSWLGLDEQRGEK